MKITMLGCGSSGGVPLVGCTCPVCISNDPKNKRLRVSVFVEDQGKRILIDTSPDLREQCLRFGVTEVDAILYTHEHADHCHGIDDTRPFNHNKGGPVDCYGTKETLDKIRHRFPYAFMEPVPSYGWFRPCLVPYEIEAYRPFTIGPITILPIEQLHGKTTSLGFRFGKFAYCTDVNELSESALTALEGVEFWIIDCLRYEKAPTHADLALVEEWVARIRPKQAILTHMNHEMDYKQLLERLPANIVPGYDGLTISV